MNFYSHTEYKSGVTGSKTKGDGAGQSVRTGEEIQTA